jgi:hypothetical protein
MFLSFPETTRHKKTTARQPALQKSPENNLAIAANKPYYPNSGAYKGSFKNARYCTANQQIHADTYHFFCSQKGIPFPQYDVFPF